MICAAIDPGVEGAVAYFDPFTGDGWAEPVDTNDAAALSEILRTRAPGLVGVEVPVGRPPKTGGYRQISHQWRAIGCAEGVVLALGLALVRVRPQEWQQVAFAGRPKPGTYIERKRLSLRLARERWPRARLDRAKDAGLADALWIAYAVARREEVVR